MPDRLYFSCWVKDTRTQPLLYQFEKMLARFPFSKLAKRGPVLRVYALSHAEPPLLEREFEHFDDKDKLMEAVLSAAREFMRRGVQSQLSRAAGKIICMSSVHDIIPWAGHVNYAASKGGILMLMKSLAQEVADRGIRVNAISPGAIRTAINKAETEGEKG